MKVNETHGQSATAVYKVWSAMKQRCLNPNDPAYRYYGGRGITICDRWLKFENFAVDMGERPEGGTLDRTDNSKGYSPENCRWVTRKEQSNNMRRNHLVEHNGETLTISQWADRAGLPYTAMYYRIASGYPMGIALSAKRSDLPRGRSEVTNCIHGHPLSGHNLYVTPDGRRQCRACNLERGRLYQQKRRIRSANS